MIISFSELWEKCEELHKDASKDEVVESLVEKLLMQINLYKLIDLKTDIPQEDREKIKSRTFGEILFTLTNLSLKDNINVFSALNSAYQFASVDHYATKYGS
jgi:hypothetical protein